jgi:hypothetical protein
LSSKIIAVAVFRKLHQLPELPNRSRLLYIGRMRKKPKQDMVKLGESGGHATLKKRGRKFFSEISKRRKNFSGGRPPKDKENHPLEKDKPRPSQVDAYED